MHHDTCGKKWGMSCHRECHASTHSLAQMHNVGPFNGEEWKFLFFEYFGNESFFLGSFFLGSFTTLHIGFFTESRDMIFGSDAKISRTKKKTPKKEDWLSDVEHVVGGTISRHNVPHTVPHELRLLRTTTHSSSCALFFSSAPSRPCGRLPSARPLMRHATTSSPRRCFPRIATKLAARALLLAAQCSKLLSMPPVRESISLTLTRSTVWTSMSRSRGTRKRRTYHNITLRRFTSRGARAFLLYSSSISRR